MHRDRLAYDFDPDGEVVHRGAIRETGRTDWVTGRRTTTVTHGAITKTFDFRLYTATELVAALQRTGFSSVDVRGALDGVTALSPTTGLVLRAVR